MQIIISKNQFRGEKPIIPDSDTPEMFGTTVNDILKFDKEVYNTGKFLNRPQF